MNQNLTKKIKLAIISLLIGLCLGWFLFHNNTVEIETNKTENLAITNEAVWTCAMHPQIRQNEPGDCPICGMELITVKEVSSGANIVEMSEDAIKLANIQTAVVSFTLPEKEIFLQGKVKIDERRVSNQTSHIPGRIEHLFVSFTGEKISAGQKLASIYSPNLITAQTELFEAIKSKDVNPLLYEASRNKLKQWKITEAQIDAIEKVGEVQEIIDVRADINGVVLSRKIAVGDYVKSGSVLFTVVDLNKVWIEFEAYESDISWLKTGDNIAFTVSSLPGVQFNEKVFFIAPVINSKTRTATIRLEINNKNGKLKPEMFANGIITAKLPINEAQIIVPKSAVMWTGKRSVVYIAVPDVDKPMFEFRIITLGHDLGNYFIVKDGLKDGERIVTNGTFKVDAAAQLAGKKSMMNQNSDLDKKGHEHDKMNNNPDSTLIKGMKEVVFKVSGNCAMCKSRIEKAVQSLDGVTYVLWNKNTKMISIHYDEKTTNKHKLSKAVNNVGHDTEFDKASDSNYDDLPACCQYTR